MIINEELPILVLIYGGTFQVGSKEMNFDWGEKTAKGAYFGMAINYRLATSSYSAIQKF